MSVGSVVISSESFLIVAVGVISLFFQINLTRGFSVLLEFSESAFVSLIFSLFFLLFYLFLILSLLVPSYAYLGFNLLFFFKFLKVGGEVMNMRPFWFSNINI